MTAAYADPEIWHVLMDADDMKRMNVDQLADAFRLSLIDASTLVWQGGMDGWRRLGSIADVEDESEELTAAMPPPPPPAPRPMVAAGRRAPASYYPPATFEQPRQAAPASYYPGASPFERQELVAPVYAPAFPAPDPYMLPQRHVSLPDKIDFRRAPGSVRWGRWLVGLLLVSGGVLGAYRQNLLREGARRIGIESTYLASEQRVTTFVAATAPPSVKGALTRLSLLPGPNAAAEPASSFKPVSTVTPLTPVPRAAAPAAAPPCVNPAPEVKNDPAVKTVSFDSLPVLGKHAPSARQAAPAIAEDSPASTFSAARAEPPARASKKLARREQPEARSEDSEPIAKASRKSKKQARGEESEPIAKATPKPKKAEPKPEAAPPPPPANESFLQMAMRKATESDAKKLASRRQAD